MAKADTAAKDHALHAIAAAIERDSVRLLEANRRDLDAARAKGLAPAMVDRLALTQKGVAAMAEGLRQIAQLPDPVGDVVEEAQDLATHAGDGSVAAVHSGRNWHLKGFCGGH